MEIKHETKKIIVICAAAILVLNYLVKDPSKNLEKTVVEYIKKNPQVVKLALGNQAPEQEQAAPPSEEEQLQKLLADKISIDIGSTPVRGNKDAKIKLIVFSDFQCPFSKRGADTVTALEQKFGNNLMFVYKNLPLPFHPESMPSAKAALAAGRQGKFYEFHDKLFQSQDKLGEPLYIQIAKEVGLNLDKFNSDRNSKEIEDQIKADVAQANQVGFNGTPGFSLNGVKVLGAYPQEHFEKIINALGLS